MTDQSSSALDTFLQHVAMDAFDPDTGSAAVPLPSVRTSTVRFRSLEDLDAAHERKRAGERVQVYGRPGLSTHAALESIFCRLEGAQHTCLASSGMAAISLVF
ncbi:MAG TPA: PLP-dependent transferase, partial [Burkholderiaceae bacterium]|nr:PLP-dependent transferase [Burkholderiaceae bacterium]